MGKTYEESSQFGFTEIRVNDLYFLYSICQPLNMYLIIYFNYNFHFNYNQRQHKRQEKHLKKILFVCFFEPNSSPTL